MDSYNSYNSGNGSFQDKRLSALLLNDYINVDERGLPELLLALRIYAENINFYDLDGQVSGHWLGLLLSNDSVFLATSISINPAELTTCFNRELSKGLAQAITENLHHIKWIDSWFSYAEKIRNHQAGELSRKISHMIQHSLGSAVTDLIRFDQEYNESSMLDPENLHPVWNYDHESMQRDTLQLFSNRKQREERLAEIFNSILNVLSLLRQESSYALEKSLTQQSHSPASALILSFLKTYSRSQDKINSFSDRLLEYYYSTVQKNKPARGGGDRVYLECKISPASEPVFIPEGSQFTAGKTDDLHDVLYTSMEDNVISGAKLKVLKTLFLQRHLLISPESFTRSITAIKTSDVLQHNKNKDTSRPHYVFGYDDGSSGFSLGEDSDVGLVISSRLLDLKEGTRKVTLEFYIHDRHLGEISSDNEIKQILNNLQLQKGVKSVELAKLCVQFENKFKNFISIDKENGLLQKELLEAFKKLDSFICSANIKRENLLNVLYKATLMTLVKGAISIDTFFNAYHQLISRHMFINGFISDSDRKDILNKAVHSFGLDKKDKLDFKRIEEQTKLPSKSLFVRYFHNAFALSITAETGWMAIDRYALSSLQKKNGFLISFTMGKSMPAIVNFDNTKHTGNHQSGAPAVMIRINPDCNIFPYSYIQVFNITKVKLKVEVKGYKSLIVQNDHGLVDRSKPFMPFGPAPVQGASCYIGGYEFAKKNVSKIIVKIRWKNLPENYAGFSGYYEGYAEDVKNSDFKALITMSSGGSWMPANKKRQQVVELFDSLDSSGILLSTKRIEVNLGGQYSTLDSDIDENQFIDMNQIKNGYLQLKLNTGNLVFGHKNYPRVLGSALSYNANSKNKNKISLPEEPYTPEIESISTDYSAEEFIKLKKPSRHKDSPDKNSVESASLIKYSAQNTEDYEPSICYLTPMGIELIQQQAASTGASFFPEWSDDGNLYIGYEKNDKIDSFNLYFNLENDSSRQTGRINNTVNWFYYSASGWKCLNNHMLLFDSTNGLRQSGIVTIKLPEDSSTHSEMVPGSLFWLRVSTTQNIDTYPSITDLKFDTLILQSVEDTTKLTANFYGYSNSWRSLNNIPGIQSYEQQHIAYDNQNSESRKLAITRFYERLRHKNRAITSWDYERLVLEKFSQLYMVKCFPATSKKQLKPSPGHVLVVVVPKVVETDSDATNGYRINAVEIKKIEDYLKPLMPANIKLEVSNPSYERIQIRCAVRFSKNLNTGQFVKELNQAISDYISPWSGKGYGVKFDWTIRKKDIESYILDLPYVSDVSRFSIINVFMRDDKPKKYLLIDSAADRIKSTHSNNRPNDDISSSIDWSLAISAKSHYIEVIDSEKNMLNREAEPVGINSISIGSTFIINGTTAISEGNNSDVSA